jgi:WD40 repeat protein
VFSVGNDARVWNPATGAQKYLFGGHVEVIYSSAISPDGTRAMTGDRDSVHVWDLDSGRELPALKVPSQVVSQITFSPSGKYVVTISGRVNGPLAAVVWETASGKKVGQVTAYKADAVFGPPEDILATEGGLINWRTGKTVLALGGDPVWSPNQRCVLTKGASGVDLRDAWTGRTYVTLRLNGDLFAGALFSRDGSFILSGDSPVKLFTTESCLAVERLIATAQQRVQKEMSSDGVETPSATPTITAKE